MINAKFLDVLRKMMAELEKSNVNWAIGGSIGLALRGAPVQPRDIDILTDRTGAYEIERIFTRFITKKVFLRTSENIRSHFGTLEIDGVKVEITGDFQLRNTSGIWDDPPDLQGIKRIVRFGDLQVLVLSLEWEREVYSRLGRHDKVDVISRILRSSKTGEP